MSRIDELIAEHCPDGVEFKELDELLDYEQPGKYLVNSTAYDDSHTTPVLTAGQTFILGYTSETSGIYPASPENPVIIFDDFTTAFKWVDFPFKAKSSAMKMITPKSKTPESLRYAYYAMQTIGYVPQDHARQWIGTYSKFRIPAPHPEVQREIVKVLDTFTKLEAELEAELEARRRQYKYYRDALLTFGERTDADASKQASIRWATLGDIANIVRGASPRPIQSFLTKAEEGIPWIKIGDVPNGGKYITGTSEHVTLAGAEKSRRVRPGDFVLSNSMSFGRPYISKIEGCIHDGWLAISDFGASFLPDFLYHLLRSATIQAEFARRAGAGTIQNLNAEIVRSVSVPVPPLEEQERIVAILDKFDALVNDLSSGLPAEIKARRQQYEHYRDRLLSFPELKENAFAIA